jgi:hypothetical protein
MYKEKEGESFGRERRRTNSDESIVRNSLESKMEW